MLELDLDARWYAGKGRHVDAVRARERFGPLCIAEVTYADGGSERYLIVDDDPSVWAGVLADPPRSDGGGRLELRAGPFPIPADLGDAFVPAADQTNTLAVLGGVLLVKAYRRLGAGVHPEVEILAALAGTDAPVPAFAGSLHWVDAGGADTAIALLQEFVDGAEAGWEAPIDAVAAHLRAGTEPGTEPFAEAGRAAAELHATLARRLGVQQATAEVLHTWRLDAEAALAVAAAADRELAAVAGRVRAGLAAFETAVPPLLSRIHGDLHYAQLLRAPDRLAVIDFEGDPTRALAARRLPDTPLRDLACLLRSIDHIGSAASRRADGAAPEGWIAAATDAALAAYAAAAPAPVDAQLLRALELAKECTEFVYAQTVLPEWTYAPRLGLQRLLA